jgi:hypothetical protein
MREIIGIHCNKQREAEQFQTVSTAPRSFQLIRDKLRILYLAKCDLRQHYIYLTFKILIYFDLEKYLLCITFNLKFVSFLHTTLYISQSI